MARGWQMRGGKAKELISILMESPLYMTLSVEERHSLLVRLEESYPNACEDDGTETDEGCDSG
jgi:hypothetical protein